MAPDSATCTRSLASSGELLPKSSGNRILGMGTGLFGILGFATLLFLTNQVPGSALTLNLSSDAFRITARFDDVADLEAGAPVAIAGVTIGHVMSISLDSAQHKAIVTMQIEDRYNEIPNDSAASIETAGLLGAEYVTLDPGGSSIYLRAGSQIKHTRSALLVEKIIEEFLTYLADRK